MSDREVELEVALLINLFLANIRCLGAILILGKPIAVFESLIPFT